MERNEKKILIVTNSLSFGGSERVVLNTSEMFLDNGFTVHLAVIRNIVELPVDDRIILHSNAVVDKLLKYKAVMNIFVRLWLDRLVKTYGPFLLILSNHQARTSIISPVYHERLYFWIHNDFGSIAKGAKERKRIRKFFDHKNLIAVSKGAARSIVQDIGVRPGSLHTIYNPFDISKIQAQAGADYAVEKPKYPFVLHAGRYEKIKRHDLLFQAWNHVVFEGKLVLLTEHHADLEKMICEYGIADRVHIVGFQKNPYPWFKDAKLTVISSDSESLSNVLIESLILKTPVVSTDSCGPAEILTGALSEFLVPTNDPAALAEKISSALANPPAIDEKTVQRFSSETVFQQYCGLLDRSTLTENC